MINLGVILVQHVVPEQQLGIPLQVSLNAGCPDAKQHALIARLDTPTSAPHKRWSSGAAERKGEERRENGKKSQKRKITRPPTGKTFQKNSRKNPPKNRTRYCAIILLS